MQLFLILLSLSFHILFSFYFLFNPSWLFIRAPLFHSFQLHKFCMHDFLPLKTHILLTGPLNMHLATMGAPSSLFYSLKLKSLEMLWQAVLEHVKIKFVKWWCILLNWNYLVITLGCYLNFQDIVHEADLRKLPATKFNLHSSGLTKK